jgi:hypothetical protein
MKTAGPLEQHRDHTAEPPLAAVVAVYDSARRSPGHLIVDSGSSTGGFLAIKGDFDCAILDVNIRGGNSCAVAYLLFKRDCPFVLTTGYREWSLPKYLSGQKRLAKPYFTRELDKHPQTLANQVGFSGNIGPESIS